MNFNDLRAVTAILLIILGGCAGTALDPACLVQSCMLDPRHGIVSADGKAITPAGKMSQAQSENFRQEELRQRAEREKEIQAESARRQADFQAQRKLREKEIEARMAQDENRGYKHTTFSDLYLDLRTVPRGSKFAVTGMYRVFGELEILSNVPPVSMADNIPQIPVLSEKAPREVRAKLMATQCRVAFCQVVLLGHTSECIVNRFGYRQVTNVCFVVDDSW